MEAAPSRCDRTDSRRGRTQCSSLAFIAARPWSIIPAITGAISFGSRSATQTTRARPAPLGDDLHRRVVVREPAADDGPDEAPLLVVDIDDEFARLHAVREAHDARPRRVLHAARGQEARRDAGVHGADIAHRVPHRIGVGFNQDFLVDRGHRVSP
jgi:hypothetical protein